MAPKDGWSWISSVSVLPVGSSHETCSCQTKVILYGENTTPVPPGSVYAGLDEDGDDRWTFWCAKWLEKYMNLAQSALKHRPIGSTVEYDGLLVPALRQAAMCETSAECEDGIGRMLKFVRLFLQSDRYCYWKGTTSSSSWVSLCFTEKIRLVFFFVDR